MSFIKKISAHFVSKLSPRLYFTLSYLHNHRRWPRFNHPRDISEIWINRLLRGDFSKKYYLADKYAVREYIKERGYENLLTPLIGVYKRVEEIDFNTLPSRFALKMNFLAGMNIICQDKSKFDEASAKNKLKQWVESRATSHSERHYNLIEPRIVCEEYIDDGSGHFPTDYKFMCIHGKVFCVLACSERETGHAHYSPYTLDWQPCPQYNKTGKTDYVERPANLDEMIKIAEDISREHELIRVDLYSNGSRIWFGELTLTPAGCMFHRWSQLALDELGEFFYKTMP